MIIKDRIVSYAGDEYGIRGLHNQSLILLEMLDAHCKKYGITYYLAFGSLLGGVRSHGFIPWDDDIDIVLKRADYDRLLISFDNKDTELSKKCTIICPSFLSKIQYVANQENGESSTVIIDLFVADKVPNNTIKARLKKQSIFIIRNIIIGRSGLKNPRVNTFGKVLAFIRRILVYVVSFPFSLEHLKKMYSKCCSWGKDKPADSYCCYSTTAASFGRYHSLHELEDVIYIDFEDIKMPIMNGYHDYLVKEFGKDYMIPPKMEDRHPNHLHINK